MYKQTKGKTGKRKKTLCDKNNKKTKKILKLKKKINSYVTYFMSFSVTKLKNSLDISQNVN